MAEIDLSHIATGLGSGGGIAGILVFLLKDFFRSQKRNARETAAALKDIAVNLGQLEARFDAHSKDLGRVEGAIDNQQKQVTAATVEMAGMNANIKALWAALQRIHPGAVKRRLSDGDEG